MPDLSSVYLIHATGTTFYKIGLTSGRPEARMAGLQTGNPLPLALVCAHRCLDAARLEGELHAEFSSRRLQGEWFDLDAEALSAVMGRIHAAGQAAEFRPADDTFFSIEHIIRVRDHNGEVVGEALALTSEPEYVPTSKPPTVVDQQHGVLVVYSNGEQQIGYTRLRNRLPDMVPGIHMNERGGFKGMDTSPR